MNKMGFDLLRGCTYRWRGREGHNKQRRKRDFTCVQPKQPNDPDTGESGSTEVMADVFKWLLPVMLMFFS